MRKLTAVTLSLLLSVAALYSSAAPASACRCLPITDTDDVSNAMSLSDLVVEGVIASGQGTAAPESIYFQPEVVYVGSMTGEIELNQTWEQTLYYDDSDTDAIVGGDCSYLLIGDPGDRYLLFLTTADGGTYAPDGCSSFGLDESDSPLTDSAQQQYDAIKIISEGGTVVVLPVSSDDSDGGGSAAQPQDEPSEESLATPWAVVLPLAFLIPLAVILVPAFIIRRHGSH